jgi:filamentous hemagglutinin
MSFPTSPSNGQTTVLNGVTYVYNSTTNAWTRSAGVVTGTTSLTISNTTQSSSSTTGALIVAGGAGIGGNLFVGGNLIIAGNVATSNYETINNTEFSNSIVASGNITTTANVISPNYLYPNGVSILSGVSGSYGNANVATYLPTYSGNISASSVLTNSIYNGINEWQFTSGGQLILPSATPTIMGDSGGNAKLILGSGGSGSATLGSFGGLGTVYIQTGTGGAPQNTWKFDNSGNLTLPTVANINWANGVSVLGTISGTYSNANVANYLVTGVNGNIVTSANVVAANFLYTNGVSILSGVGVYGNTNVAAYLNSTTINAGPIITPSVQTGNITSANGTYTWGFDSNGSLSLPTTGIISGGTSSGAQLKLGSDTNVHLSSLQGANVYVETGTGGNVVDTWRFDQSGNLTLPSGGMINFANGESIFSTIQIPQTYANSNVQAYLSSNLATQISTSGDMYIGGNLVVVGNSTVKDIETVFVTEYANSISATGNISTTANIIASGNIITTGNIVAPEYLFPNGVNVLSTVAGLFSNVNVSAYLSSGIDSANITTTANVNAANVNVTANLYASSIVTSSGTVLNSGLTTAGNVTASSVIASGGVSAQANITTTAGVNAQANIVTAANVLASAFMFSNGVNILSTLPSAYYSNANVIANLVSLTSNVTTTANVTASNINATANVYAGNIITSSGTVLNSGLTTTGNVVAGNVNLTGDVYTAGIVTTSGTVLNSGLTTTGNVVAGNITLTGNIVAGGVRSTSSSTPPSNPTVGDIWYDTTTDDVYRYTSDGTSSAWLDITGPTIASTPLATLNISGDATVGGNLTINGTHSNVVGKAGVIGVNQTAQLDDIVATWSYGGSAQFQIYSSSGTISMSYNAIQSYGGTATYTSSGATNTLNTTPTNIGSTTTNAGDTIEITLINATSGNMYKIVGTVGPTMGSSMISITRIA